MKVIIWIGKQPNQEALVRKIAKHYDVVGIVYENRKAKNLSFKRVVSNLIERIFLPSISKAWKAMQLYFEDEIKPINIDSFTVENINSNETLLFTKMKKPDLIVVSGTRLIKKKLLNLKPRFGITNLHTGLSPYVKGGPNCTNWCIATNQFHLVGNTIMWLDEGIDSGNIIKSQRTLIDWNNDSLSQVHIKVMEHAHLLYIEALKAIQENKASNINQNDICKGNTFYTKQWSLKYKFKLVLNFNKKKVINNVSVITVN